MSDSKDADDRTREECLESARRGIYDGVEEGRCNVCGREYGRIEPDAAFECHSDGCDGTVKSGSMKLGII